VPAVVEAWLPGEKGGQAVAEVPFGEVNPSGRLPVTAPRHAGQLPVYYNYKKSKRYWVKSGWGKPYVDMEPNPLYPFGHGLSYTRFEYEELRVAQREIAAAQGVELQVEVRNAGDRPGAEVVQVYVEDLVASVATPVKQLCAFTKVLLQPGQARACSFRVPPDALALYDANLKRVVEPGQFRFMVGSSSEDIRQTADVWVKP
jgi:beta-glucosidase